MVEMQWYCVGFPKFPRKIPTFIRWNLMWFYMYSNAPQFAETLWNPPNNLGIEYSGIKHYLGLIFYRIGAGWRDIEGEIAILFHHRYMKRFPVGIMRNCQNIDGVNGLKTLSQCPLCLLYQKRIIYSLCKKKKHLLC